MKLFVYGFGYGVELVLCLKVELLCSLGTVEVCRVTGINNVSGCGGGCVLIGEWC